MNINDINIANFGRAYARASSLFNFPRNCIDGQNFIAGPGRTHFSGGGPFLLVILVRRTKFRR